MLDLAISLILGLTALTAFSGLIGEDDDKNVGNGDETLDDRPEEPGDDLRYLDVDTNHEGSYVGSEISDTIVVRTETSFQTAHLWDKYEEEMQSPLSVRGGGGDDVLILGGRGYVVHGDEGADVIELREASNVAVYAGTKDTVLGGTGEGNYVNLDEDAAFVGGAGNDLVHSSSTASTHLGDGNDTYIGIRSPTGTGEVASLVHGGNGDDFLAGSMRAENLWWEHATDSGLISFDSDTLFGDEGNDTILGSHNDYFAGGSGDDCFILVLRDDASAEGATIADFKQGEDRIEIRYESTGEQDSAPNACGSISHEDFRTEFDPEHGFKVYSSGGQMIAHFQNAGSLLVGIRTWDNDSTTFKVVGLDGNAVASEKCDIMIQGSDGTAA